MQRRIFGIENEYGVTADLIKDSNGAKSTPKVEKLAVGWSGTIWIINVHREQGASADLRNKFGRAEVVTMWVSLKAKCLD